MTGHFEKGKWINTLPEGEPVKAVSQLIREEREDIAARKQAALEQMARGYLQKADCLRRYEQMPFSLRLRFLIMPERTAYEVRNQK